MHGMEYGGGASVPAFLAKLWTLVDDGSTDEIIAWDQSGSSFHIFDQTRLAKEVLPIYFKHNNMASFVRQLNMYGFRKILQVDHGGMKIENDDMEFAHQYFQKGKDYLLDKIKRKVSNPVSVRTEDHSNFSRDDIHRVLTEVHDLKSKTEAVSSQFDGLKRENETLWREVAMLRQKHIKQQSVLNKLVQFLITVVGPRGMPPMKRKLIPLMIGDGGQQDQGPSRGPKVARQYRAAESQHSYQVEQPRTPLTNQSKGVTIEEVFDDPREFVNVGDFSDPNIVFVQAEESPATVINSNVSRARQNAPVKVEVEDLLDDPDVMENVAQGIRRISAESKKKARSNVPIVTVQNPISAQQPVTINVQDLASGRATATVSNPHHGLSPQISGQHQGKVQARSERRKSSGLKVKMPSAPTTSQFVTLPNKSTAQEEPLNQMTMALPGTGAVVNDVGDNLETIDFDLESLKDLLSDGYNLDTNTLLGLFSPEGPVPSTPEHLLNLDENPIKLEIGDIAGNEMIQYNPPEDLSTIFDLQDIAPVTEADGDLVNEESLETELNTPMVTPLDGEMRRISSGLANKCQGTVHGVRIKKEMEDVD